MMRMDVRDNIREFRRTLARDARRQLPFAVSKALNDTAFAARQNVIDRVYPDAFDVKNRSFARAAFRVRRASKRTLKAAVFDTLGRANLALHASGGVRRPRGAHLAVPVAVKRTASGRVPKGKTPRALQHGGRSFVTRLSTGNLGIVVRKSKGVLEVAYTLPSEARIRKRFRFYERTQSFVDWRFPIYLRAAMRRALATARR